MSMNSNKNFKQFFLKKNKYILLLLAAVVVVVILGVRGDPKPQQPPLAQKPAECLVLAATGKQTYDILADNPKPFQIVQVSVDPIDVKEGETQKIMVTVKDDDKDTTTERSSVTASVRTDNKNTAAVALALRLSENSQDDSSLLTTWEGSWIREGEYCHTYMQTITATNDRGEEAKIDLSFK